MEDLSQYWGLGLIPIITGLIQLGKHSWPELDERWWPLVAWVLGIAGNLGLAIYLAKDPVLGALLGCVVGLSASGFYSQAKTYAVRGD